MSDTGIKLKSAYSMGVADKQNKRVITTKAQWMKANVFNADHSLNLDLYFSYCSGYRALAPNSLLDGGVSYAKP